MNSWFINRAVLAAGQAHYIERDGHYDKAQADDGCKNVGDAFPAVEPYVVVDTQRLDSAPESVGEVEPQSYKPNEVKHYVNRVAECLLYQRDTILGIYTGHVTQNLIELHLVPEIEEVQRQAQQDDDTQHEHVLRGPFYGLRTCVDQIAVVTTGFPVLQGQPEGVDDVNHSSGGDDDSSYQSIPVSSQEFAYCIVAVVAD